MYPVEYLDSIDFFVPERTICAHGSWVKKSEMRTMAERKAILAHCPSSNMKLACGGTASLRIQGSGSGSSPRNRWACIQWFGPRYGSRSTHGMPSTTSRPLDASALVAKEAFAMATTGSQDWAVWDLSDIRMNPVGKDNERHISNLIYNGGQCVDLWVDGNPLMQSGSIDAMMRLG